MTTFGANHPFSPPTLRAAVLSAAVMLLLRGKKKKKKNVQMSRLIFLKVEPGAVEWKCCVHSDYSHSLSPSVRAHMCACVRVLYTARIRCILWRFDAIRNTERVFPSQRKTLIDSQG